MAHSSTIRLLGFRLNPNDPYKITPKEVSTAYFALGRPIWRHQKKMQRAGQVPFARPQVDVEVRRGLRVLRIPVRRARDPPDRERQNADGDSYRRRAAQRRAHTGGHRRGATLGRLLERLPNCARRDCHRHVHGGSEHLPAQGQELLAANCTTFRSQLARVEKQVCQEFGVDSIDELL